MFYHTVTTLKPEIGKLMYKDYKQVCVNMLHYCILYFSNYFVFIVVHLWIYFPFD